MTISSMLHSHPKRSPIAKHHHHTPEETPLSLAVPNLLQTQQDQEEDAWSLSSLHHHEEVFSSSPISLDLFDDGGVVEETAEFIDRRVVACHQLSDYASHDHFICAAVDGDCFSGRMIANLKHGTPHAIDFFRMCVGSEHGAPVC
jgi:hypothetical protein